MSTLWLLYQLIFLVCLLCAKHHVGVVYASVLREGWGEREGKRHTHIEKEREKSE